MSDRVDPAREYLVLILAPTAKDAEVSRQVLAGSGIACAVCKSLAEVCAGIEEGAGGALLTQEAILSDGARTLAKVLQEQPPWSAFPLIVLTPSGAGLSKDGRDLEAVGPMTLMKRPVQIAELVSAVRAALRDRGRQYRTRDLLATIRESEEKFRTLAESIPQLAWMARPDGHIFWYNRRWYEYTGTSPEQMEGWGWRSAHDPNVLPSVLERWGRSIEGGEPFDMVFPLKGADGQFRSFLTRVMPVRGDGRVVMWFGTNTDVEDQRRAEAELRKQAGLLEEARAEAEGANRMKDEFLAILSHELRTPLNAIVGWAKILRSGKADAEDLEDGLAAIERNSRVQTQLIEDLLDVSRIASGNLRLEVQRLDIAEVIDAAIGAVSPAANAKAIRIVKMLDSPAAPITGDPARLQQVVWNLLTNAVKFTPKGGQVQVLLERVNSHVEVSVVDTGMGIAPEFLPYVFDRFRQADSTTTRRHGGLGLGLSIVKQLVEMHGGTIRARSPGEGQGATFTVMLPITVIHPERPASPEVRPVPRDAREEICQDGALAGLRVLVVDDEPDARQLIRRVLTDCEAEVSLAASVAEALREVERFRPDVIVSDIGMPDQDGYDFIRQVRARYTAKQIPAAALTAFARTEDRKRALLAGFQTHITKPVDPAELTAAVASLACRTGSSG